SYNQPSWVPVKRRGQHPFRIVHPWKKFPLKHLRAINDGLGAELIGPGAATSSLNLLETIAERKDYLTEIHLERLQVSDIGLMAISKSPELKIFHLVTRKLLRKLCIFNYCKPLRKLRIDGWRTNRIGDEGLIAIVKNSVNLVEFLPGVNPSSVSLIAIAKNC
ncbi:Hypothetical predicted protein, partial [Olea europaea subsp. europaea]